MARIKNRSKMWRGIYKQVNRDFFDSSFALYNSHNRCLPANLTCVQKRTLLNRMLYKDSF